MRTRGSPSSSPSPPRSPGRRPHQPWQPRSRSSRSRAPASLGIRWAPTGISGSPRSREEDRSHHDRGDRHGVPDPDVVQRTDGHRAGPTATCGSPRTAARRSAGSRPRRRDGVPRADRDAAPWIVVGSDDNLWFTENSASQIGRITTAGVVTEFVVARPRAADPLASRRGPTATSGSPSSTETGSAGSPRLA